MDQTRLLLASDMDGTVLPPEMNPEREEEIASFRAAVEARLEMGLAYVTGRDFTRALEGIDGHGLPVPDFLACDVGTSVYRSTPSGFELDQEYARLMEGARGGLDVREVRGELAHIPGLLLQPPDRQTESKLSYYLSKDSDHARILASVQEILDGLGGTLQAVFSVGAYSGAGLLDLLPAGVAKDFAIRYLRDHTGVDRDALVFAGDSGNDLAAMLSGFRVIVVGNAPVWLKDELMARGGELNILDRIYFAKCAYADGVLEGCRHFGIL